MSTHPCRPSLLIRYGVILTLWLAAVMPAFSQGLAALRGDVAPWSQLCSSSMVSPSARKGAGAADDNADVHGIFKLHCGAVGTCAHPAADSMPPPQDLSLHSRTAAHARPMPMRYYSASQGSHVWRSSEARGPPSAA
ncbi:DUF2946 family protein [Roseateles koreensis]|uniref:DUF2946 family protein n=1 Tax=Roseateles koreensis TaxID=2987526 RepID=A0ABT5KWP7_9BURK|nr:DUF2946 family protein [Roseateles koreensis]MDC8786815.1 DUF2946 family protein [Roseateles koreensis]